MYIWCSFLGKFPVTSCCQHDIQFVLCTWRKQAVTFPLWPLAVAEGEVRWVLERVLDVLGKRYIFCPANTRTPIPPVVQPVTHGVQPSARAHICKGKGKAIPLQACSGPEGSRKLRFPDFMTTAQGGGKVVSLRHRPHLPLGNSPGTHFC